MDHSLNLLQMKRIVKDADMYEENMPRDELVSLYNVITKSKEEDDFQRANNTQEELAFDVNEDAIKSPPPERSSLFTPKTWTAAKLQNESSEMNESGGSDDISTCSNESLKDATKLSFGFNDMQQSTESNWPFIRHELKLIPIQETQTFLKANNLKKAKMLYSYHTKINLLRAQLAAKSLFAAPLPNPFSVGQLFLSTLDDTESKETYISRSGRQTKRKVYYDLDEDSLDGISSKKTKNSEDQQWFCKKKSLSKKSESTSVVKDTEKENLEIKADTSENSTSFPRKSETHKSTPKSKKLTNTEIMKKSSLFSDSPPRLTRSDLLFEKLKEENEKTKKEEEAIESFCKTLENLDEEMEKTEEIEVINVDDEEPTKRRVIPPQIILGRKPINHRRDKSNDFTALDIKTTSYGKKVSKNSPSSSQESINGSEPPTTRKRPNKKIAHGDEEEISFASSSNVAPTSNNVPCPICGVDFPEKKIEEHASTCGDEPILTRCRIQKLTPISCNICDAVIPLNTTYEVHVKDCIQRQMEQDMRDVK